MRFIERFKQLNILSVLTGLFFLAYCYFFWQGLGGKWFHPDWSTDDALQQLYPFHKVIDPEIFAGDYITRMMECYLAPLHYWLSYGITLLTEDPIMMGHWVMLLQILMALFFIFMTVRHTAGTPAGFFAATWFLHTRYVIQRMTGGLPRGWAATVLAGFLYFLMTGNHLAVLAVLFVGCLLHPPTTLICAVCYGIFLLWKVTFLNSCAETKRNLLRYILLSPIYLITVFSIVRMPPEIGNMVTYEQALEMPEFQRVQSDKGRLTEGRFPFVPLSSVIKEVKTFAFMAFTGRLYDPGHFVKKTIRPVVVFILFAVIVTSLWKKIKLIPPELYFYLLAIGIVYQASRLLAFRLYVPDRHLQFPMAIFFILAFTIGIWRLLYPLKKTWSFGVKSNSFEGPIPLKAGGRGMVGLLMLGAFIYMGSGTALQGSLNFNCARHSRGSVFEWISKNLPQKSLIAGHPSSLDYMQLFGMRKAYATTETYHPFFDKYLAEITRRLTISFRALYSRNFNEFVSLLIPEGIDYFLFERRLFYPDNLKEAKFTAPFDKLVRELSSGEASDYVYKKLPSTLRIPMTKETLAKYPIFPYWDESYVLVDVKKLASSLEGKVE